MELDFRPGIPGTFAQVKLLLRDGSRFTAEHDSGIPATDVTQQGERLEAKFAALVDPVAGAGEDRAADRGYRPPGCAATDPEFAGDNSRIAPDARPIRLPRTSPRPMIASATREEAMRLKDKVAIVTGGAHGMGEAEVRLFAKEGAAVVIADVLEKEGEAVAAEINAVQGRARFIRTDVTSESDWQRLIAETIAIYGRLDILVNNAGISGSAVGDHDDLNGWLKLQAVNSTSVFLGTKHAAAAMVPNGRGLDRQHLLHHGVRRWLRRPSGLCGVEGRGPALHQGGGDEVRAVTACG